VSSGMYRNQRRRPVVSPDQHTLQETFIEVGDGHTLYMQEWGTPHGMPIIFLHGGPGSGCNNRHKQVFDPERHHVVFFDQRGSGRSIPFGLLAHNTTEVLITDIEKVAKHCKMPHFTLVGGSWGSCLALAYGLKNPKQVDSMVLRGIFTGSQAEINYIYKGEFRNWFPDIWEALLAQTPKSHRRDPGSYHLPRALGDDPVVAKQSAYVLQNLEGALLSLDDRFTATPFDEFDPTSSIVETHYLANTCFLPDRHILEQAHKLTMPIWLIQGRYDMVCPPITAYELNKALPNSELIWTTSGHRAEREVWNVERSLLLRLAKESSIA
jgi:proline iminopeptidase